jgi:hypothetical protein
MVVTVDQGPLLLGVDALLARLETETRTPVTLAQLRRIRRQYRDQLGEPARLPGGLMAWNELQVVQFIAIVTTEARCRR